MAGRAEELYNELQNAAAILALIGTSEDSHFDCKEWPARDDDAQKMLAKAACGLTNAEGGVLVIGMKAEPKPKDEPDVVTGAAPMANTSLVKSRVLGLISNLVEPGIVGIQAEEINESPGSKAGFVVVHVPKSDGPPRRSRKDWKFYQRIGSATLPMDYWQIEDMFGVRPHPKLALFLEPREITAVDYAERTPLRRFVIGIENTGRGIARFPGVRFDRAQGLRVDDLGIDGNGVFGLPRRASEPKWFVFRGGIDDVIYPGETRLIGKLMQPSVDKGTEGISVTTPGVVLDRRILNTRWFFPAMTFQCEISCEGMATITAAQSVAEDDLITNAPRN